MNLNSEDSRTELNENIQLWTLIFSLLFSKEEIRLSQVCFLGVLVFRWKYCSGDLDFWAFHLPSFSLIRTWRKRGGRSAMEASTSAFGLRSSMDDFWYPGKSSLLNVLVSLYIVFYLQVKLKVVIIQPERSTFHVNDVRVLN